MGKVDDMRKQREAQHAAAAGGDPDPEAPADVDASADTGKCSVCGKLKALQNGLIAPHQKGLGKMCIGSRRPPA
jgi:hypothetical protein